MTPEEVFGRILRDVRREHGLSQERLAEVSGYHRTYVSLLERGINSPSLSALFHLAVALDTTPSVLLQRVEEELGHPLDPGSWVSTRKSAPDQH